MDELDVDGLTRDFARLLLDLLVENEKSGRKDALNLLQKSIDVTKISDFQNDYKKLKRDRIDEKIASLTEEKNKYI